MSDLAAFHRLNLLYIWEHEFPPCIICNETNAQDWHHIYGRGGKKLRKLHSSVFNAAPVCRCCHAKGDINTDAEELLEKVTYQIAQSGYVPNENDHAFIRHYTTTNE